MNRRQLLSLAYLAPLIMLPEPRRVYSFLDGWLDPHEAEYEKLMRLARESVRKALDNYVGRPLAYEPFSVASVIEEAVIRGGRGIAPPWMPRVIVESDAFFLKSKTMNVRIEWQSPLPVARDAS